MPRPTRQLFERLVHEHHAAVHRAARRLCADDAAAADIAQEVFLRVLGGNGRLEGARSERATLCWLATRLAANAARAARRRAVHEEHAMHDPAAVDRLEEADPSSAGERRDLQQCVLHCVEDLPPELRAPLLLRYQDELTLAAIGTALRLPTSTVHDRVEHALLRVRRAMAERGHAVAPAAMGGLFAHADATPTPAGLESRLLALGANAPALAVGVVRRVAGWAIATIVVVGVTLVAWQPWRDDVAPARTVAVARTAASADEPQDPPASGSGREPVVVPSPPSSDATRAPESAEPGATFTGTVHDAAAWPVAGAKVRVVAAGGYKAFELGEPATTDARGAFTITARAGWLRASAVRLVVSEHGRDLLTTGELVLPPPTGAEPLQLVLPAAVGTATSQYESVVDVRDEAGVPLAGVDVHLYAPAEPAPRHGMAEPEASATSGADGRALLRGRGAGPKWLLADGRACQRVAELRRVRVDAVGASAPTVVVLAAGAELRVVVSTVSGRQLAWSEPWLEDERTGLVYSGIAEADGSRRFRGLGPGPFTVHARGDGATSPAARSGVVPGEQPVLLRLKECDDERDIGDHLAELHGELVDGATGEVVAYGPFELEVERLEAFGSSSPFDGIAPSPLMQQKEMPDGRWTRFHETGLAAGRWLVTARIPGYARAGLPVELRANEVRGGLRVVLQRPAAVRGVVRGKNGDPLAGAFVFVVGIGPLPDALLAAWQQWHPPVDEPHAGEPPWPALSRRSDELGRFTFDDLPPGVSFRLAAWHDEHGMAVAALPVLRAGDTHEPGPLHLSGR